MLIKYHVTGFLKNLDQVSCIVTDKHAIGVIYFRYHSDLHAHRFQFFLRFSSVRNTKRHMFVSVCHQISVRYSAVLWQWICSRSLKYLQQKSYTL